LLGWTLFTAFTAPVTLKTGLEGRPLPAFDMQLYDSLTHLNTTDIPTGQPLIVIGFSPTCTHCQAETADLIKNIEKFRNVRICFITGFPLRDMQVYYRYYKLKQYPNIIMGRDSTNAFLNFFKADAVPYTAVYDSRKRLKRVMNGQAAALNLAKAIED
jgi:thiol-disulfide isomerase/thioredoxin